MEKPTTIPLSDGAMSPPTVLPQNDPVLLTLPRRRTDGEPARHESSTESCLEQLHVIETDSSPKVERELLVDLLARRPGLEQILVDPSEVHNYQNPLAGVNAYKHRLHALRCEYVNVRLRVYDLETQVNQMQKHIRFLDATLEQMRASRGWKLVEKCSQWRRSVSQWLGLSNAECRMQNAE